MPYRKYRSREVLRLLRLTPEEVADHASARLLLAEEARRDMRCLTLHRRVEAVMARREGDASLRAARLRHRHPKQAIERVIDAHRQGRLRSVADLIEPGGGWLSDFVIWLGRREGRLPKERAVEFFGTIAERSSLLRSRDHEALCALQALLSHRHHWSRSPRDWRPSASRPAAQVVELARHLLGRHPVPSSLERAWMLGQKDGQAWYVHLTLGGSIRSAPSLPFRVSKAMVKHVLRPPSGLDARSGLRYAQVRALGAPRAQALALARTRLGRVFEREAFWLDVIRWFLRHPEVEARHYALIVDWVQDRRHVTPEGERGPLQPGLDMRRRSPARVFEQAVAWGVERNEELRRRGWVFPIDGIRGTWTTIVGEGRSSRLFRVVQLGNTSELMLEGRRMQHCVATYSEVCRQGHTSIWSLREGLSDTRPLVTLEVRAGQVVQAKTQRNGQPTPLHWSLIERWCEERSLVLSKPLSRRI